MDSLYAADRFARDGYLQVDALIDSGEVGRLRGLYDRFLDGSIHTGAMRADLGAAAERKEGVKENITQIMWPSSGSSANSASIMEKAGISARTGT